jgi:hypothetical protein
VTSVTHLQDRAEPTPEPHLLHLTNQVANLDLISLEVHPDLDSMDSMGNSKVTTVTPHRHLSSTVVDSNNTRATGGHNTEDHRNNNIPVVTALKPVSADRAGRTTAVVLPEATGNKQVMAVQHKVVTTAARATTTITSTTRYALQYTTNHSFLTCI